MESAMMEICEGLVGLPERLAGRRRNADACCAAQEIDAILPGQIGDG
jgi:hypothetical protein